DHALSVFVLPADAAREIYTLSLHDALPICGRVCDSTGIVLYAGAGGTRSDQLGAAGAAFGSADGPSCRAGERVHRHRPLAGHDEDRKSTRLNSSHVSISYAVCCLNKKNT